MTRNLHVMLAMAIAVHAMRVAAFDGHKVKEGPLVLTIEPVEDVTEYDTPQQVVVTLKNEGKKLLAVKLKMAGLVDEWRPVGRTEAQVQLDAEKECKTTFMIAAGRGACSALYPVHIYAEFENGVAHAVQIFKSDFTKAISPAVTTSLKPILVPARGALALNTLRTQRIAWCYYDKPLVYLPVGWHGTDAQSSAYLSFTTQTRGLTKSTITMHPPWKPVGGSIFAEYLLKLPETKPIKLVFSNAIRDHTEKEPPSDGVTFRVWAGEEKIFERHTASKVWVDGEADLTQFAGKEILLRLECHPGPARNTLCDTAFWGEPTVVVGNPPLKISDAEREQLRERARKLVQSGMPHTTDEFLFKLDDGQVAALVLGKNGISDSALAFGAGVKSVVFDGIKIAVLKNKFGEWPSQVIVNSMNAKRDWLDRLRITHHASFGGEDFRLMVEVWQEKAGLRVRLQCPKRITDIALGPADQKAPRVYYGHGYCIIEPEAFRAGFGGHNLSTSHVGFEFERGVSLLTACDTVPDFLEVNPEQRLYALHTHMDSTLTFVSSLLGAFDCAFKYRPLYDKRPAGGVRRKAGRFVFDIWGGRYAEIAEAMRRAIAYGLTDSLLTVHNWQRWGYDYRLPDIYPPNPKYGTIAEMQQIAQVCKAHDIPWGLHDNYIDFYPDAEGYSYELICFTEDGRPIKAWYNEGRNAQSYRWQPHRIMPFVKRNLVLIKHNLRPTHYFIDVFASATCFDYYDRQGNFYPSTETRKCWGDAFAWIRNYLGSNAPTTSEAGHDQLIGYLDGADCQHLELTQQSVRFGNRLLCKDWERVPWFDAVNHHRFILHGVGYSNRYQCGRSRTEHGVESDDYITSEILEGHALMIDWEGMGRGAVRKYWLAQDFIRSIALDHIVKVEFVDGDIHRQIVTWKCGAKVYVNRGEKDWSVAGKTLPKYGYFAKNGEIESSIEKIDGVIVEQSRGPSRFYFNGRGQEPSRQLRIRPALAHFEYLGDRKFRMTVSWDAQRPAPKDLNIFLHFDDKRSPKWNKIAFSTHNTPRPGSSTWTGTMTSFENQVIEVPKECGPGEYDILIGLWDPESRKRYALIGEDDGSLRYRLGTLIVEGTGDAVKVIRVEPNPQKPQPPPRFNVQKTPINFGPVVTVGALRCEVKPMMLIITPLPDSDPFSLTLRLDKLPLKSPTVRAVRAVGMDGAVLRNVKFESTGASVTFQCEKDFAYQVRLGK